jgi:hypothetical protein
MNALALHPRPLSTASTIERRLEGPVGSGAVGGTLSEPAAPPPAHGPSAATPPQASLLPARLVIELDAAAERFVQTLVSGAGDTVRRYPDEAQLAFSRGVNAYMAALLRA